MKNLRVIFMGTPQFAVPVLKMLIENCHVVMVVSQPDREKDRKGNLLPTPIKKIALENGIEVYQPFKIKDEYEDVIKMKADIIITCAYGQIIPEVILNSPQYGCINVHGSLLPKLRGGAPIHHAIINGDKYTGMTIMYMAKKMDAGDIIATEKVEILDSDDLDSLYEKMSLVGANLLRKTLPKIIDGTNERIPQDESLVTYGYNITKEEEKIDFNNTALKIFNLVRGLSSVPGAYCYLDDLRMKIYACELTSMKVSGEAGKIVEIDKTGIYVNANDVVIKITDIKIEGRKRSLVKDFINGIKKEEYIGKVLK